MKTRIVNDKRREKERHIKNTYLKHVNSANKTATSFYESLKILKYKESMMELK